MSTIAVLGAGVSGLTCAVVLREAGFDVTIVAREIDGTTSEAAAAIWYPYHIGCPGAWALETRAILESLDASCGVTLVDFELLDRGEVMRVPLMDTTRYLPYLRARFGGAIVQREVRAFRELDADVIVNCAGFGARALCDDEELMPGYGIAVVMERVTHDRALARTADPLLYVIPRERDCVLGGYDQPVPPDANEAAAIVARCRAVVPALSHEVRNVKHGIRPVRPSVRLEVERLEGKTVVHNYGHGGAGFTVSWACANRVLELIRRAARR